VISGDGAGGSEPGRSGLFTLPDKGIVLAAPVEALLGGRVSYRHHLGHSSRSSEVPIELWWVPVPPLTATLTVRAIRDGAAETGPCNTLPLTDLRRTVHSIVQRD